MDNIIMDKYYVKENDKEEDVKEEDVKANIIFLFEELENETDTDVLTNYNYNFDFDSTNDINNPMNDINNYSLSYFIKKELYGNDELYYEEYKIKELMKICEYYGIAKNIKASKCKKQDIIATIIYFENCPENYNIVEKRNTMWGYINALLEDSRMKGYILW